MAFATVQLTPRRPVWLRAVYWIAALETVAAAALTLLAAGADLLAPVVNLQLPVASFWPQLKPSVRLDPAPVASIASGGFRQADVGVSGLGLDARLWLAGGHLFLGAVAVSVGIAIAVLCARLLRGNPFGPALSKTAFRAAGVVAVAGIASQVCAGVGGMAASAQALAVTGWGIDDRDVIGGNLRDIGWPLPSEGFTVDSWPVAFAIAIVAVAVAFRFGERLQAQSERLLQEKLKLQHDTEGLV
ncbi:hypothetical protein [Lacisediminihabitans sp.]|jgi:hypothetical protein|uniref:hypothetical protein n=1 Tax=Lacisediminihabitans sp. TaxID=2787631 RepID=UPI002F951C1C